MMVREAVGFLNVVVRCCAVFLRLLRPESSQSRRSIGGRISLYDKLLINFPESQSRHKLFSRGRVKYAVCDAGAKILRTKRSLRTQQRPNMSFIDLPARSPGLNPVEKMWGWVGRQLRIMDLRDLSNGVPVLGKTMNPERIKRLLRSKRVQ